MEMQKRTWHMDSCKKNPTRWSTGYRNFSNHKKVRIHKQVFLMNEFQEILQISDNQVHKNILPPALIPKNSQLEDLTPL